MKIFNIEKGSEKWFGVTVFLLSLMLIFTSLGKTAWLYWISAGFSIILGILLYREGGVRDYLMKKGWKRFSAQDIIVITSFIFGTFLITNGILLIKLISDFIPAGFVNFMHTTGVIGGIASGILAIFLILTPKPKA